jgi:hypothetical protein
VSKFVHASQRSTLCATFPRGLIRSKIGRYLLSPKYLIDECDLLCVLFGCILHRFKRTPPFRIAHALQALSGFSLLAACGGSSSPTMKASRVPQSLQAWWPRLNRIASPLLSCSPTGAVSSYDAQLFKAFQVTHGAERAISLNLSPR